MSEPNAISGAIIQRLIIAAAREMGQTLMRATRSPVLFEAKDFATGIFDPRGRVVEYHQYLPLMAFCLAPAVSDVICRFGDDVEPGDVFLHNDVYAGGTHGMDVCVIRPIFAAERLVGWCACKGHMLDWGGPVAAGYNSDARSAWDEPLRVPAVHLYRRGERCDDVFAILNANVRLPQVVVHDVDAMVGCTAIGARRMVAIVDRFGADAVEAVVARWLEASGASTRAALQRLPRGVFTGDSKITLKSGEDARIRLALEVRPDRISANFDGTSPQTESFVNAPYAVTEGAVFHCLAMLLGPEFHFDQGFLDTVDVSVPKGCLLNAQAPAAVGYCLHLSDQISEAFFCALAPALPDHVLAGWLQWGTTIAGEIDGRSFATPLFFASKGGSGATYGADGYDYIGSIRMAGALEAEDVEIFEQSHPWAGIERLEYWADSGGAGQWRGGLGAYAEIVLKGEKLELATFGSGRDEGAYGLFGGNTSPNSRLELEFPDGRREDVPALSNYRDLAPGTILRKWNTGGGGYGDPNKRERALVEHDLKEGYISREAAIHLYNYSELAGMG